MAKHYISTNWICEQTMQQVALLPCQKEYIRQFSAIMSFHVHRNELMDLGMLVDDLPAPSAVVVAPTGQGKTFLLRKMAEHILTVLSWMDVLWLQKDGEVLR